jgi:hypothetical protein
MTRPNDPLIPGPDAPCREPWERPEILDYDLADATQANLSASNNDTFGYS